MFGSVRRCVDAFVKDHAHPGPCADRVVSLDATNGAIDGCCYLFLGEDRRSPVLVAKAARTPPGRAVFETEHTNLESLVAQGVNAEGPAVPAPLGRWRDGETLVTLQSALDGALMKNVPGRNFFSRRNVETGFGRVFDWWLHLQRCCGTRAVVLSGETYAKEVLEPIALYRRRYLLEEDEISFLCRRYERERTLEGLELPFMIRHGDFCAANMVLQQHGIGVFDWEFPLRHGAPLFDLWYFFSSVRFPYTGRGGESSHFDSFVAVYGRESYFRAALRNCLRRACERFGVPGEALPDLFVLALIDVANMKYEGLLASHGVHDGGDDDEREKSERWSRFDVPDRDEPFARIRDGVFENLRWVVRRGLPEF
jgi:hypothetical protein